jgi:hypothetical protein
VLQTAVRVNEIAVHGDLHRGVFQAVLGNTGLLMAILGRAGQFADWSHLTEA